MRGILSANTDGRNPVWCRECEWRPPAYRQLAPWRHIPALPSQPPITSTNYTTPSCADWNT